MPDRRSHDPHRALTKKQLAVAELVGRGLSYEAIAHRLHMGKRTVRQHVHTVALLLPNPDELTPRTLVMLWAAHRDWTRIRRTDAGAA